MLSTFLHRLGQTRTPRDLPPPRPELGDKRTSILDGWTSGFSQTRTLILWVMSSAKLFVRSPLRDHLPVKSSQPGSRECGCLRLVIRVSDMLGVRPAGQFCVTVPRECLYKLWAALAGARIACRHNAAPARIHTFGARFDYRPLPDRHARPDRGTTVP